MATLTSPTRVASYVQHIAMVVTGAVLSCPCRAGDTDGFFVRLLSSEMWLLDAERQTLQAELHGLPPVPERQVTGRLGYHSGYSAVQDTVEWVEMDLRRIHPLDAIVLIATPADSSGSMQAGYGFPLRFRVEIATEEESEERVVVVDHTQEDFPNPGVLPVYLPAMGLPARYVRITVTRLAREGKRFFFSIGEVMPLSGERNVAIGMTRDHFTCSRTQGAVPMWGLANLVDGHIACGPPVGLRPSPTLGCQIRPVNLRAEPTPAARWMQIDLGETLPIDEVRLFPARPPEFAHRKGYGYPQEARLELSLAADFADPTEAPGFHDTPRATPSIVNPGDNMMTYNTENTVARHIRFTATTFFNANGRQTFALSEMQVWSGGRNVALGRPVTVFDEIDDGGWSTAALVDGFTSTGEILDWSEWLSGLSRRREAMEQLTAIESRARQLAQQSRRAGLVAFAAALAAGVAATVAWSARQRQKRRREMESLRLRIAQDLHDEIGSSLGSIALIAQDILADDTHVKADLAEIKAIADDTVDAMREITKLVQSDRYGDDDLPLLLRAAADRTLRSIRHTIRIGEQVQTRRLSVDRQRDVMLIFKEALQNIARHSAATDVDIELAQTADNLLLTVKDNGHGFDPATVPTGMGLANLRRRAEKHRGSATIVSSPQGTTITLLLPFHA
jgi:signal transduction histidine kinase